MIRDEKQLTAPVPDVAEPTAVPETPPPTAHKRIPRLIGNQAMQQLVQTKLISSAADNPAEHEANQIAKAIARGKQPAPIRQAGQGMAVPSAAQAALQQGGQPLEAAARQQMEQRFEADFSQVRVHTNTEAAQSAAAMQSRAYTSGQDIVFGAGAYQPGTQPGQALLAHELTHVVQQNTASHQVVQRDQTESATSASQLSDEELRAELARWKQFDTSRLPEEELAQFSAHLSALRQEAETRNLDGMVYMRQFASMSDGEMRQEITQVEQQLINEIEPYMDMASFQDMYDEQIIYLEALRTELIVRQYSRTPIEQIQHEIGEMEETMRHLPAAQQFEAQAYIDSLHQEIRDIKHATIESNLIEAIVAARSYGFLSERAVQLALNAPENIEGLAAVYETAVNGVISDMVGVDDQQRRISPFDREAAETAVYESHAQTVMYHIEDYYAPYRDVLGQLHDLPRHREYGTLSPEELGQRLAVGLMSEINYQDPVALLLITTTIEEVMGVEVLIAFGEQIGPMTTAQVQQQDQLLSAMGAQSSHPLAKAYGPNVHGPFAVTGMLAHGVEYTAQNFSRNVDYFWTGFKDGLSAHVDEATIDELTEKFYESVAFSVVFPLFFASGLPVGVVKQGIDTIKGIVELPQALEALEMIGSIMFSAEGADAAEVMGFEIGLQFGKEVKGLVNDNVAVFSFKLGMFAGPLVLEAALYATGLGEVATMSRLADVLQEMAEFIGRLRRAFGNRRRRLTGDHDGNGHGGPDGGGPHRGGGGWRGMLHRRRMHKSINKFLKEGPDVEGNRVDPVRLQLAEENIRSGAGTPEDHALVLQQSVLDAWDLMLSDKNPGEWWQAIRGACGGARPCSAFSIESLTQDIPGAQVQRVQSRMVLGREVVELPGGGEAPVIPNHAFNVVSLPDPNAPNGRVVYVVDPSFAQFMQPRGLFKGEPDLFDYPGERLRGEHGNMEFANDLLTQGFFELTEENARLYARALNVPEEFIPERAGNLMGAIDQPQLDLVSMPEHLTDLAEQIATLEHHLRRLPQDSPQRQPLQQLLERLRAMQGDE